MADAQEFDGLFRWRCIGPFRGGRVVAVSGSYDDPNTFYFGTVVEEVWQTDRSGPKRCRRRNNASGVP